MCVKRCRDSLGFELFMGSLLLYVLQFGGQGRHVVGLEALFLDSSEVLKHLVRTLKVNRMYIRNVIS